MNKFMIEILLQGIDNETRIKLLPKEQEIVREWEENGIVLASYVKAEFAGAYLVLMADKKLDADKKLSTLPYYSYMKIEIIPLI